MIYLALNPKPVLIISSISYFSEILCLSLFLSLTFENKKRGIWSEDKKSLGSPWICSYSLYVKFMKRVQYFALYEYMKLMLDDLNENFIKGLFTSLC